MSIKIVMVIVIKIIVVCEFCCDCKCVKKLMMVMVIIGIMDDGFMKYVNVMFILNLMVVVICSNGGCFV